MAEQTSRKILILIAGSAGHGKDSFADALCNVLGAWTTPYRTAYAYGIKKILHETYGVPWLVLNGDKDVKESTYVSMGAQQTSVTVRRALQKIGQFHRDTFGPTCWAAATLTRCLQSDARICVVTDARHPAEEIHWIGEEAAAAGYLVLPVRVRRESVPVNPDHLSESLILEEPDDTFSFLVKNDGSLDDLGRAAEQLACAAVLLQKAGRARLPESDLVAFGVRSKYGFLVAEPTLVMAEAVAVRERLAKVESEPHHIEAIAFDAIREAASGY